MGITGIGIPRRGVGARRHTAVVAAGCTVRLVGALVVLAAQAGKIEPGTGTETVVLVRNTGDVADTFHVSVEGLVAPWAVVDPLHLRLDPGEEGPVWVRFRPPRSPHTAPGRLPFSVVVGSEEDPGFSAVESGVLEIGTFSSVAAAVTSAPSAGARFTELVVTVKNAGNRRATVEVTAESGGRNVSIDVTPSGAELGPGEGIEVVVRVRPPRRLLPGRGADRELTIGVVSDGGALATLRPELPDEPQLANELIRSARVLGVILLLLVIGGVALINSEGEGDSIAVTPGDETVVLPTVPVEPTSAPGAEPAEAPPNSAAPGGPVRPAPALPRLAFVRVYGPSSRDIVVREPGARASELRLRSDGALESRPRLAPDGAHVAFIRERDTAWKVCVSKVTGGESVCVAEASTTSAVAWTPDGRSLLYTRGSALRSISFDVETNVAGEDIDLGISVPGSYFDLSPDGSRIAYAEGRRLQVRPLDGGAGIHVEVPAVAQDPVWSPDGTRLAYTSSFQIYSAPAGDGPIRQLTADGTVNGEAAWTGEGNWVVFRSNRSGSGDLYAVRGTSTGGNELDFAQVTTSGERETTPAF